MLYFAPFPRSVPIQYRDIYSMYNICDVARKNATDKCTNKSETIAIC